MRVNFFLMTNNASCQIFSLFLFLKNIILKVAFCFKKEGYFLWEGCVNYSLPIWDGLDQINRLELTIELPLLDYF